MNTQRPQSLTCLVPGVTLILVLAVVSEGAQRVPPTARQAAAMPEFASKLYPPAGNDQHRQQP